MADMNKTIQASGPAPSMPQDFKEPECALIPAGPFLMGCEVGRDDEKPVHRVWIDEFELAVIQVRNRDYAAFLADTGHSSPPEWNHPDFNHPDQPVVSVNWFDAAKYCEWLSLLTGRHYRLPTEAEWERAARGGREEALYVWGDVPPDSWPSYIRRWKGEVKSPLPAGLDAPSPYGLFDMGENVHEWCADWFDRNYYSVLPDRNPQGPDKGERRASRGGSWRHHVKVSRCAARSSIPPSFQYSDYGFRVARDFVPGG
ncbi:MAG: formylglycine-generating enzyme family protein [Terriglobia bacterium]